MDLILIGIIFVLVLVILFLYKKSSLKNSGRMSAKSMGLVESIKEIGELVALTAFYKEITTESDGNKLFGFVQGRKMAIISEFDIEYRYDLTNVNVRHISDTVVVTLPEFKTKINTNEIHIYDEKDGAFLKLLPLSISTEDRNRLIKKGRENAVQMAKNKSSELQGKIERSARLTLESLFRGIGVSNAHIEFTRSGDIEKNIEKQLTDTGNQVS